MDEAIFSALARALSDGRAVVLASVLSTRGATPRKRAARMLVDAGAITFSVGGGAMEARVVAARTLLDECRRDARLQVTLNGREGAAGICGGDMDIALRRWQGEADLEEARRLSARLAAGESDWLSGDAMGASLAEPQRLLPRPRLLILGAGHCGQALAELAVHVDFDTWVADARQDEGAAMPPPAGQRIGADSAALRAACATGRALYVVLLNRDWATDVAALRALVGVPCAYLGMMGSARRIAQVRRALPEAREWLADMEAPVGMAIGAQTPHEIAISILARLIARRSGQDAAAH